ncbi:hypothetical protein BH09PSE4_BH09PSE4_01560 [soil metagenome]
MLHDHKQEPDPGDGASPQSDRRQGGRYISILRVAKLRQAGGDELCVVRNISEGGLMVHTYSEVRVGMKAAVEFKDGHVLSGCVRWVRDALAGIQFEEPIDVTRLLAATDEDGRKPRGPRLGVEIPALMRLGTVYKSVVLCDISQGGAKVPTVMPIALGTKLVLSIRGLPPIAGSIRWQSEERTGIAFDVPIPFETLASGGQRIRASTPH